MKSSGSPTLFDVARAREARDAGISQVAWNKDEWLAYVRERALRIINMNGVVTADDLRIHCPTPEGFHPNIWGAVFKDKRFKWTGRYTTSSKVSSHARVIRVWGRA